MVKIALIVGSVREQRLGIKVARWMGKKLKSRNHTVFFIDPVVYTQNKDSDFKMRVSYIMKTLSNEPQKRMNDLYPLLQIIMRPNREVIPQ